MKIALSSVKEKQIRDAVKKFFEGHGYFVPSGEFNIGVRPDVVVFKCSTEYEIEAIAVECKKTPHSHSLIEGGRTQACQYQQAFPTATSLALDSGRDDGKLFCRGVAQ